MDDFIVYVLFTAMRFLPTSPPITGCIPSTIATQLIPFCRFPPPLVTSCQFTVSVLFFSHLFLQIQIFPKQYHRGTLYNRGMSHTFTSCVFLFLMMPIMSCLIVTFNFAVWESGREWWGKSGHLQFNNLRKALLVTFLSNLPLFFCLGPNYTVKDWLSVL